MSNRKIKVALLQVSSSFGGAQMRMAKYALALAEINEITPVLVINRALSRSYRDREYIRIALSKAGIEIRVVNLPRFWLVKIGVRLRRSSSLSFLAPIFGWLFPSSDLIAIHVRDVDVVHSFMSLNCLDALLDLPREYPATLLHEVTSHSNVTGCVNVLATARRRHNFKRLVLCCVSGTVKQDLDVALDGALQLSKVRSRPQISVNQGPLIATLLPWNPATKRRRVVFGHRLIKSKNGIVFAKAVANLLKADKHPDWEFCIFGRGGDEDEIRKILKEPLATGWVVMGWTDNLEAELSSSSVFVSIISTGNYPSQSVFEALGHGNLLCLSDTGLTKAKFGEEAGVTFYCETEEKSVAEAITAAISRIESVGRIESANAAREHFKTLQKNSGYIESFTSLYKASQVNDGAEADVDHKEN